jgi:hypothetical protein
MTIPDPIVPAAAAVPGDPIITAPDGLKGYAKTIATAIATAVLLTLSLYIKGDDSLDSGDVYTILVGVLGASGFTYATPNAQLLKTRK